MAEVAPPAEVTPCSNLGCDQPGTNQCSACKTTVYCSVICQTADWSHHKEECPGHLLKVGKANLEKAKGFKRERNWAQVLHFAEIAATKLKQLKDRRLETVLAINDAMEYKFDALQLMDRHKEALECAKECYTLWAMNHLRNPMSMVAALGLIQSCIQNGEFEDAERYARHAYFMIAEMTDNFIPVDKRPQFLADVSYWLAAAILGLAQAGGILPAEKQKAGKEAIELARKALELHTQLFGTECIQVASDTGILAGTLDYFNNVDDDEVLRLREQMIAIYRRLEGSLSVNVAVGEGNLGNAYSQRASRAEDANDLDRCLANLELALPHRREVARIYSAINHVEKADNALRIVAQVEEEIRLIRIDIASTAARRG